MNTTQPDNIISILDMDTANKIAAGEVVERPASVIKELVENSIDAQATEITIEIADGGKQLIRVTDNGIGMSRDDAVICLQRHATSKIRSAEDLFAIHTLGFRGEALPSIASVARFAIITRREGVDVGTMVNCDGGEVADISDKGTPVGTSISVSELFYNVPARQKFLKTAQTELGHIVELLNRFIVSHPCVDFTLLHNDRQILRSSGSGKLEDALLTVFGRDAAEAVIPITGTYGPYTVRGFVSRPSYSKPNRAGQLFYVNQRYVRNRNMIHALDDAYRGILPQGRFPLLVAFIEVAPDLVDVNVHPTKIEVKFVKEWEVHSLLSTSIREALSSSAVAPTGDDFLPPAQHQIQRPEFAYRPQPSGVTHTSGDLTAFREALAARIQTSGDVPVTLPDDGVTNLASSEVAPVVGDMLRDVTVLAQARNMYIVAQNQHGILIIDQHVAHERILYDRLYKQGNELHVQRLMMPLTLNLSHREAMVVENKLSDLQSLGFEIEPFGKDAFVVRGVPALVAERNYEQVIRDTIEELTDLTLAKRLVVQRDSIITTTACKMAVKAGDRLSLDEMSRLVSDLRKTSNPYLCPHGRPIVVSLSNRELDKMFGRI